MRVPGPVVLAAMVGLVVLFMVGVYVVSDDLRQDYRVASRGDTERTDVALTATHVTWLENPHKGAVLTYDLGVRQRATLQAGNASLDHPLAADGDLVAWVDGKAPGPFAVRVHDRAANRTVTLGGGPGDNLTLPGKTLEGRALLVAGSLGGAAPAVYRATVAPGTLDVALEEVKLRGPARILDGNAPAWDPADPPSPLRAEQGRAWWWDNATLVGADLADPARSVVLQAGGAVQGLDADGDRVVWAEAQGRTRRVHFADLATGARGEVSAFPGDQHGPAVNGTRVLLIQDDGLVRFKDLASGDERIMPARTQENIQLRIGPSWAAWLSGTIEGHNVLIVPLDAPSDLGGTPSRDR